MLAKSIMGGALEFILNGQLLQVEDCSPNTTLLEFLRNSRLTGSKEGCAEGDCGACSVAMVGRDLQGRPCYRAINSCLVPLSLMAGREILSVEGVACQSKVLSLKSKVQSRQMAPAGGLVCGRELHPVQDKMVECHGSQCGYCTPGFILSMFEGYYRQGIRTQDELDDQLSGNLCRCTGYRAIRDAAIEAFREKNQKNGKDAFAERLKMPVHELGEIRYELHGEKFFRPASLEGLLQLIEQFPDGRLIAGA